MSFELGKFLNLHSLATRITRGLINNWQAPSYLEEQSDILQGGKLRGMWNVLRLCKMYLECVFYALFSPILSFLPPSKNVWPKVIRGSPILLTVESRSVGSY